MSVTCWYYDVRPLASPELFSLGLSLLPWEARREQVMRFRLDRDRRLCLGAGLLLAFALRRAGATDLSLRRQPDGKPECARHPEIHFNLSHSGTLAVCAVSHRPVGVDVERIQSGGAGVEAMCFQPLERAWLDQSADHSRAFTRLWTRKESYLKLLGTGLSRPPRSFSVWPGEAMPEGARFFERKIENHLICVCTAEAGETDFRQWRFP